MSPEPVQSQRSQNQQARNNGEPIAFRDKDRKDGRQLERDRRSDPP